MKTCLAGKAFQHIQKILYETFLAGKAFSSVTFLLLGDRFASRR
jgi:hypothetical protein